MLTSLAASSLTWSTLSSSATSSGNDSSNELEKKPYHCDLAFIKKRDKKALVKVI
jgi:hypothetical protein